MRPIELKIKGINSYREEQVINFNQLTSQGFLEFLDQPEVANQQYLMQ